MTKKDKAKAFSKTMREYTKFIKKNKGQFNQMGRRNDQVDIHAYVMETIEYYRHKPKTRLVQ